METKLLGNTPENIKYVAEILKNGGLAGIPTETVYGLAANALDGAAVAKIFAAKGRPADNPLIVHIADFEDIQKYCLADEIPKSAVLLAKHFWPGPLTLILKKGSAVPDEVSAGLNTVAIRFPSHPAAQAVIAEAGLPLAAPSANISGSPSPTTAEHVMNDLGGKIDVVLDGGECEVGLESTVITLAGSIPRVLRPGGVTVEQLRDVLGAVEVDDAVMHRLDEGKTAASPGMKYKHYAPKANVVLLKCTDAEYIDYVTNHGGVGVAALCCDEDIPLLKNVKTISLGKRGDYRGQAHTLFDSLRRIDGYGDVVTVYSRLPETGGVGMAVYNRLIRAAGFEVIDLA
ncbi:MAG TPA: threonylcarbamoyl-AMP synthase [Ruminococcaceae bacterium]|nr:threonylcarbamoyl-AMP synthase [Oscillospiraceae bacterium]